jgi:hypothetical protein
MRDWGVMAGFIAGFIAKRVAVVTITLQSAMPKIIQ